MEKVDLYIDELEFINSEVNRNGKSVWKSYTFAILLGWAGVHRFYIGKPKSALCRFGLSTLLSILAIATLIVPTNIESVLGISILVLFAISVVWQIVDLFLIPKWINKIDYDNEEKAFSEIVDIRGVSEDEEGKGEEYE